MAFLFLKTKVRYFRSVIEAKTLLVNAYNSQEGEVRHSGAGVFGRGSEKAGTRRQNIAVISIFGKNSVRQDQDS